MALSIDGWINGITSLTIIVFGFVFGLFVIYQSRKIKAKLLFILGLVIISLSYGWIQVSFDFLSILFTGENLARNSYSYGYGYSLPFVIVFTVYFCSELIIPEKKWHITSFFLCLAIILEVFLIIDPSNSVIMNYPDKSGEGLIDFHLSPGSAAYFLGTVLMLSAGLYTLFGYFYKFLKSTSIIKKKYFMLFIGVISLLFGAIIDTLTTLSIIFIFSRSSVIFCFILFYLALREEPEKKEKIKPDKEVKVEGDLFRIAHYKKEDLTEEEVSVSKEKKICLVCKGRVRKFEVYLCDCDAHYCHKCARALIDLENACWVCGEPIDESKPVKPFKKEEKIDLEISEKHHKKPKIEKKYTKK